MRYVAKGGTLIALPLLQRPWFAVPLKTVWPSGLRRWLQAPVRKGVGSNPTAVTSALEFSLWNAAPMLHHDRALGKESCTDPRLFKQDLLLFSV